LNGEERWSNVWANREKPFSGHKRKRLNKRAIARRISPFKGQKGREDQAEVCS
jgi:hypothetical protein